MFVFEWYYFHFSFYLKFSINFQSRFEPWSQLQWLTNYFLVHLAEAISKLSMDEEEGSDADLIEDLCGVVRQMVEHFGRSFVEKYLGKNFEKLLNVNRGDGKVETDQVDNIFIKLLLLLLLVLGS